MSAPGAALGLAAGVDRPGRTLALPARVAAGNLPTARRTAVAAGAAGRSDMHEGDAQTVPQEYQLLAIDLDGTLLDSAHALPARNREALHRAHEAGIRVVLCTGRSFTETRGVLEQIGLDLDATITVGGALLSDARTGETLESCPMSAALARRVGQWFRRDGYALLWLHDAHAGGDDGFAVSGALRHPAVDIWLTRSPCRMRPASEIPPEFPPTLRISVVNEDEPLQSLARRFLREFGDEVSCNVIHVPAYRFTVLESFAGAVTKWSGIERLCRRWGIDPRQTVAIGDDVNDVSMLASAGLGVAVANARPAALAAAQLRVAGNDECGVAELIERLLA